MSKYKSKSDPEYLRVINKIKSQIAMDPSNKIDLRLFILTQQFTIDDWKAIRSKQYYKITLKLSDLERKKYLLELVNNYLKDKKN